MSSLSHHMSAALGMLHASGFLIRQPGGFWTAPDAEKAPQFPGQNIAFWSFKEYASTQTLEALAARGYCQRVEISGKPAMKLKQPQPNETD